MLGLALRERRAPGWLLAPVVVSPAALALVSVTMYPPLFLFLSLTAWGWARGDRPVEVAGWNLAILVHELALLVLAFRLLPRAIALVDRRELDPRPWLREAAPYPAAIAWGLVMVLGLLAGGDPRGGIVASIVDPSPNAQNVMRLKPGISLVFALTLVPLLRWPRLSGPEDRSWGLTIATALGIIAAPFYRYMVALVPLLVAARALEGPSGLRGSKGLALVLGGSLLASAGAGWAVTRGADPINAADVPGLVDHEDAVQLLEPGERTVVRSPPSFAHVLRERGWTLVATGGIGPNHLVLERSNETITLLRAETPSRLAMIEPVDAVVLPTGWERFARELPGGEWTPEADAGRMTRWVPAG